MREQDKTVHCRRDHISRLSTYTVHMLNEEKFIEWKRKEKHLAS